MKMIEKILNRHHTQSVKDLSQYPSIMKQLKQDPLLRQLQTTCDNDFSYWHLEVILEGLKHKQTFENTYDKVRNEHFDLWDYISFKERRHLVMLELEPLKNSMKTFMYEDQTIFIPFFNVLMNSLYDKEMPIFELPQFLKMYKVFKEESIDVDFYGYTPYEHRYTSCECVYLKDQRMILYHPELMVFYEYDGGVYHRFPLNRDRISSEGFRVDMVVDFIVRHDEDGLISFLANCDYLKPSVKRECLTYLRKKYA